MPEIRSFEDLLAAVTVGPVDRERRRVMAVCSR